MSITSNIDEFLSMFESKVLDKSKTDGMIRRKGIEQLLSEMVESSNIFKSEDKPEVISEFIGRSKTFKTKKDFYSGLRLLLSDYIDSGGINLNQKCKIISKITSAFTSKFNELRLVRMVKRHDINQFVVKLIVESTDLTSELKPIIINQWFVESKDVHTERESTLLLRSILGENYQVSDVTDVHQFVYMFVILFFDYDSVSHSNLKNIIQSILEGTTILRAEYHVNFVDEFISTISNTLSIYWIINRLTYLLDIFLALQDSAYIADQEESELIASPQCAFPINCQTGLNLVIEEHLYIYCGEYYEASLGVDYGRFPTIRKVVCRY